MATILDRTAFESGVYFQFSEGKDQDLHPGPQVQMLTRSTLDPSYLRLLPLVYQMRSKPPHMES